MNENIESTDPWAISDFDFKNIDDSEFQQELEELLQGTGEGKPPTNEENVLEETEEFQQSIRAIPGSRIDDGDFNVENMRFDPEVDGNDPQLLSELNHLTLNSADDAALPKDNPEVNVSDTSATKTNDAGAFQDSSNLPSDTTQTDKLEIPLEEKPDITRPLMRRILAQAKECKEAAKTYLKVNDRKMAIEFLEKSKALEADLHAISNEQLVITNNNLVKVNANLPIDLTNREIEDGILRIEFEDIKGALKTDKDFAINIQIEWPPEDPLGHKRSSPPFRFGRATETPALKVDWPGVNRDLRCSKYFEHHKMQLELVQLEKSFFGKIKQIAIGTASLRLAPIATMGKLKERVDFVDAKRKSIGASVIVSLTSRAPLSPKIAASKTKSVEWTVLDNGQSGKIFGVARVDSSIRLPNLIEDIVSYVVLEQEIAGLKRITDGPNPNPKILSELLALENKLDALTMAVDTGQLEIDSYLKQVSEGIKVAKQNALYYKRNGNLNEAKRWLRHIQLMEDEISEAHG